MSRNKPKLIKFIVIFAVVLTFFTQSSFAFDTFGPAAFLQNAEGGAFSINPEQVSKFSPECRRIDLSLIHPSTNYKLLTTNFISVGNFLTKPGGYTFTYDNENCLISASGFFKSIAKENRYVIILTNGNRRDKKTHQTR